MAALGFWLTQGLGFRALGVQGIGAPKPLSSSRALSGPVLSPT